MLPHQHKRISKQFQSFVYMFIKCNYSYWKQETKSVEVCPIFYQNHQAYLLSLNTHAGRFSSFSFYSGNRAYKKLMIHLVWLVSEVQDLHNLKDWRQTLRSFCDIMVIESYPPSYFTSHVPFHHRSVTKATKHQDDNKKQ